MQSMSDATCVWPWATYMEIQSNPHFVAASAWLGVCGRVQGGHQSWFLLALSLRASQQKAQGTPRFTSTCLSMVAAC